MTLFREVTVPGTTCKVMQAIQSEARDGRIGLSMMGDDEDLEVFNREVQERKGAHRTTCAVCNDNAIASPAADAKCSWVHDKMKEHAEVQVGLTLGYGDHELARTTRLETLDEIRAHIDGCLDCRTAFRDYLGDFLRQLPSSTLTQ